MPAGEKTPHRVLLVDDEVRVTHNLRALFRRLPLEVFTAASAEDALALLAEQPVDVVVSDERMPGMPGSRFLAEVRRLYPDTVRMILTGQASLESTIDAINEGGIFRFLTKPCDGEDLVSAIEEAVSVRVKQRAMHLDRMAGPASALGSSEAAFEAALDSSWMAYQPILSGATQAGVGYEALLRPDHPEFPGPMELIHTAEMLGRIPDLELRVFELISAELDQTHPDLHLLVNLHPQMLNESQIFDADLPLHRHSKRIYLEITERAPLESVPGCREKVAALRERGYRIALDDLGAGYSGLASFAELQPDLVKFDRTLVSHVQDRPVQSRLISSVVRVCQEMSITTVAEGVEHREERDHLVALGCDYFQGFFFGRPGKAFPEPNWNGIPPRSSKR